MSLGETLRLAREEKGKTISQMAEATRMMVQIVEDLEREDFRRIAAPIYGRGFIKLYAEHLGLEPEPLLREFMEIYTGSRQPKVVRRTAAEAPTDSGPVEQPDHPASPLPAARPAEAPQSAPVATPGEPDLFSVAAGRLESVRTVPDPDVAAPAAVATPAPVPARVRPAPTRMETPAFVSRREIPRPGAGERAASADPLSELRNWLAQLWTPTHTIALAVVGVVLVLALIVVRVRKASKTPHIRPLPIAVERVLKPSAPFFD